MQIIITKNHEEMSQKAAEIINNALRNNPQLKLGLATGGTPERLYELLIDAYKSKQTDWAHVKTFNLDEYVGVSPDHPVSYHHYMQTKLFDHVNVPKLQTFLPSGVGSFSENAQNYEKLIREHGGIDLQILGIGENGHIAFNEPGSKATDRTRVVDLTDSTIDANSRYFKSKGEVPKQAITMGIGTILEAKQIILLASGFKKRNAIRQTIDGTITDLIPGSFLQNHPNVIVIVDEAAAAELKTYRETAICGV